MAKNVKNKKKKRSNYDDKLIKIIAISLAAAVVVIVAAALIISYTGSYVAKVDGERIMRYEYQYFLQNTMYEMKNDAIEEGILAEDASTEDIAAFWTAERKQKAEKEALEEARKWKAQYIIAEDAGFALDYEERYNYKVNLENQLYSQYNQQYAQYCTFDEYVKLALGMELDDYEEVAIQTSAITAYKDHLKKSYSSTDEELRAWYDESADDFRKVTLSVLALERPEKPEEVKKPEAATDDMTEQEKAALQVAENEYKDYCTKLEEYNKSDEELRDRVENKILKQLKENGKYTEEKKAEDSSTAESDSDKTETAKPTDSAGTTATPSATAGATEAPSATAGATEAPSATTGTTENTGDSADKEDSVEHVYKEATLADIAAKEGALFSDNSGEVVINALSKSGQDVLDDIALSMQWREGADKIIVRMTEDGTEDADYLGGEQVDGVTYTQYVMVEDEHYYYIFRCIGIEDFDNSTESSEGAADSVKDIVRRDLYEDKAEKALDKMVADAGDKYKITSKKESAIKDVLKDFVWS